MEKEALEQSKHHIEGKNKANMERKEKEEKRQNKWKNVRGNAKIC